MPVRDFPDSADLAPWTGRCHLGKSLTAYNQRTRIHKRKIVSSGPRIGRQFRAQGLSHRNGFAGQQQFIGFQILARDQGRIRGHAVTLVQDDEVATDDFTSRNAFSLAIPEHERARACQVAQCIEHALAAGFLHDGDDDRGRSQRDDQQRFLEIAEADVDHAGGEQHQQHRFAQNLECDLPDPAPPIPRQLVGALGRQARGRFSAGQPIHISPGLTACRRSDTRVDSGRPSRLDRRQTSLGMNGRLLQINRSNATAYG